MNDTCEEDETNNFVPGDLLWAKVGKFPFWPCMVTYHPMNGNYRKIVKKNGKTQANYHVQYFGPDVQRGWALLGNSIPFKGETEYVDRIQALRSKINDLGNAASKSRTLSVDKYKVLDVYKVKWKIAVKEAEEALLFSTPKERFENYVFSYDNLKRKISQGTEIQLNGNNDLFEQSEPSILKKIRYSGSSHSVCDACQLTAAEFSCSGICKKSFHLGCVGLTSKPENFKCIECLSGNIPTGSSNNLPSGSSTAEPSANSTAQPSGNSSIVSSGSSSSESSGSSNNVPSKSTSKSCFICMKSTGAVKKCSMIKCHKFYHTDCVSEYGRNCIYNIERNICPHHICITCYKANPNSTNARKGAMVKCVRCPTAFHNQETCIAAGSVEINRSDIICPHHFVGKDKVSLQQTCNMDVCSLCLKGGILLCCEACPNAFHEFCVDMPPRYDIDYICDECKGGRYLLYSMIVFTKIGNYRWWPAKIIHPSNLPDNVKNRKHYDGEFAVKFYGSYDYYWSHSGRTFPYVSDHKSWKPKSTNRFEILFKKSIDEAATAFDEYISLQQQNEELSDEKPEYFKSIRVNRALPPAEIFKCIGDLTSCCCKVTMKNPCGINSGCLNRTVFVECQLDNCKTKNLCQNQKFQKRDYAETKVFRTKGRGWGLAAVKDIKKEDFIMEYVGEVITHEEHSRRSKNLQENGKFNYYFLYLDSKRMIDAGPMGNMSRFINHSCEPNCAMMKWIVNGDLRIGIFAIQDISIGEELTFDYQSDKYQFQHKCFCAAEMCRGFIGKKPTLLQKTNASINKSSKSKNTSKTPSSNANLLKIKDLEDFILPKVSIKRISEASIKAACGPKVRFSRYQKKRKSSPVSSIDVLNESDNQCFICKKTGSLLLCDEVGCVRAYHLKCIGLTEIPKGQWFCAIHLLHSCSICQKPPDISCRYCPTSFCRNCWKITPLPALFICQICEIKIRKTGTV